MLTDDSDGKDALCGVWESMVSKGTKLRSQDNLIRILAYLDDTNMITSSLHCHTMLHKPLFQLVDTGPVRPLVMARRYINLLKEEGYDLDQKDSWGRTPLLDHLWVSPCEPRLEVAYLLLEFGADIHAVDCHGKNALQISIGGYLLARDRKLGEQTLGLLIKAGADVNHCDNDGHTPSDTARQAHYWKKWCRVLVLNGLDISEVVSIDKKRRRDFFERKRQESGGRADAEHAIDEMEEEIAREWNGYSAEGMFEMWCTEPEVETDEESDEETGEETDEESEEESEEESDKETI